ncbi:hypothetical protein [Pectobacterium versatile]|uniref:hypothetical protein n=1 Tax=Pectobacterium versatile TaxID=2488639 RepID=UPI001B366C95|nr:hypothetical protein [Pectobacterium versatile]MBQ4778644.1 hypothetical protein [Pectobacterium versatile]
MANLQNHKIYTKLVENKKDIVGMIAYSIYKREKLSHISQGEEALEAFIKVKNTSVELKRYRNEAKEIMEEILRITVDDRTNKIKESISENILSLVQFDNLTRWNKFSRWHNGGASGIFGNLYTVILSAFLVYLFSSPEGWKAARDSAVLLFKNLIGSN